MSPKEFSTVFGAIPIGLCILFKNYDHSPLSWFLFLQQYFTGATLLVITIGKKSLVVATVVSSN